MDRQFCYPSSIPLETDILNTNRYAMVGMGYLAQDLFGAQTVVNGFACTPTSPASLNVNIAPGRIYSMQNVDSTAYSSLAADTIHQILKQGILATSISLSCPAPGTAGFSINYLVEVAYQDSDTNSTVLPYYDAANPSVAFSGPGNSGTAQATTRQGLAVVQVKAGTAATTGTQTTPAADTGFVGLFVVTVAHSQSTITSGNIVQLTAAPFNNIFLSQNGFVTNSDGSLAFVRMDTTVTFGTIDQTGHWTVNAPTGGSSHALSVINAANSSLNFGLLVQAPNTSGQSFGLIVKAGTTSADYGLLVQNAAGSPLFYVNGNGATQFPAIATTASAANAFIDNSVSNSLFRSTSSIRYKRDITDLNAADAAAVLRMRPVRYRSKSPADDPDLYWYGLVAEEVADVDPRLVHYDAEGRPEGVQYDRIGVHVLAIVQRMHQQLTAKGVLT